METSAKNGTNVQEIFIEASKILYKDFLNYEFSESSNNNNNKNKKNFKFSDSNENEEKISRCC